MRQIPFLLKGGILAGCYDTAILSANDDPVAELAEAVVGSISTGIMVQLGEHTVHLAMLQNPDHWSEDWEELGIEDVDEFVAGLVEDAS